MTYIPNVRKKSLRTLSGTEKDNPYWEGYLTLENKKRLEGFDNAVDAYETAINNLDTNPEIEDCGVDLEMLDAALEDDETAQSELENTSRPTRAVGTFILFVDQWLEVQRNELVVSMIENQDDEDKEDDNGKTEGK